MEKGTIIDNSKRNWQAECIYLLFMRYYGDIEYVIDDFLTIENFENCRERGYTIKYKNKEISFAEHRNGDSIVIYPFKWKNNPKRERDFERKSKHLKYQQFQEAFDYILNFLDIEL